MNKKLVVIIGLVVSILVLVFMNVGVVFADNVDNSTVYFIAGDANDNGRISVGDLTIVERYILGYDKFSQGMDANRDGDVNMGDVIKIERYILNLDYTLGDCNHSGQVDQQDIEYLQAIILGAEVQNKEADINCDGEISLNDITCLELMLD